MKIKKISLTKAEYLLVCFILFNLIGNFFCCFKDQGHIINSDMSSELLLAELISKEGGILSSSWYYSTELRILNMQLITAPLFYFFEDWAMIRAVSNLIIQCIMLASYYFMLYPLKIRRQIILLTSLIIIFPFSHQYRIYVLYGAFYAPHIAIMFIMIGLFLRLVYFSGRGQSWIYKLFYFSLAFICGLSGIRYLLIIQVPLFLSAVWDCFLSPEYENWNKQEQKNVFQNLYQKKRKIFFYSIIGVFLGGIGYICNIKVISKIYSFSNQIKMVYDSFKETNFMDQVGNVLLHGILENLGVSFDDRIQVISISGFMKLFVIIIVFLLIYCCIRFWKLKNSTEGKERFLFLFFIVTLVVHFFIFVFVKGSFAIRYYLPCLIMIVPFLAVYYFSEFKIMEKRFILGFILTVFSINSLFTFYGSLKRSGEITDKEKVAQYLKENDFSFGYATFWNANVITEFSDGAVRIKPINRHQEMKPSHWLTTKEDTVGDYWKGKIFVLLTKGEEKSVENRTVLDQGKVVYDDQYVVYEYPNDVFLQEQIKIMNEKK